MKGTTDKARLRWLLSHLRYVAGLLVGFMAVVGLSSAWAVAATDGAAGQVASANPAPDRVSNDTDTPTSTATPNETPTAVPMLVGHVTWQGIPQSNAHNQMPITLTLKLGTTEINYPAQNTDSNGFFTVSVGYLMPGMYSWRVKSRVNGSYSRHLANSGTIVLSGNPITNVEMGLMKAGDSNNDNVVNTIDYNMLKNAFGCDFCPQVDFNNDLVVSSSDFALLKGNYGHEGAPPIGP